MSRDKSVQLSKTVAISLFDMNALLRNVLITTCVALALLGCKKAPSDEKLPGESRQELRAETIASIHWLGKKQISADTNSAFLSSMLDRPEGAAVKEQFLDKLALAPWRSSIPVTNWAQVTNYAVLVQGHPQALLLRSVLETLLAQECRLDVGQITNAGPLLQLSIKAPESADNAWSNNITAVIESLCADRGTNLPGSGLRIKIGADSPMSAILGGAFKEIELSRSEGWWTVRAGNPGAKLEPPDAQSTNAWLAASVNLDRVMPLLGSKTNVSGIRELLLTVSGEGNNVRTIARVWLSSALPTGLDPWKVPTNLVREPLVSFTAARQANALSTMLTNIAHLPLSALPNQGYVWAREGVPFQTYFAARPLQASNDIARIAAELLPSVNAWMTNNGAGQFRFSPASAGITWFNAPFMKPFLQPGAPPYEDFLTGGLFVPMGITNPPPFELFGQLKEGTGLVYYDWELTGPRTDQWIDISQLSRIAFYKPQIRPNAPALLWIKAAGPSLGNTVTTLQVAGTNELVFSRKGPIGLTGVELHLLIDWLESPAFPRGFHTTLSTRPKFTMPVQKKNPARAVNPVTPGKP